METSILNIKSLAIKARTKNELYRLLSTEANMYLSPQQETSIYFARDAIQGKRK